MDRQVVAECMPLLDGRSCGSCALRPQSKYTWALRSPFNPAIPDLFADWKTGEGQALHAATSCLSLPLSAARLVLIVIICPCLGILLCFVVRSHELGARPVPAAPWDLEVLLKYKQEHALEYYNISQCGVRLTDWLLVQVVRPSGWREQPLGSHADPSKAAWESRDNLRSLFGQKRSKDSHARYRADSLPPQEPDTDVLEEEEEDIVPLTAASLHFEVRCSVLPCGFAGCC